MSDNTFDITNIWTEWFNKYHAKQDTLIFVHAAAISPVLSIRLICQEPDSRWEGDTSYILHLVIEIGMEWNVSLALCAWWWQTLGCSRMYTGLENSNKQLFRVLSSSFLLDGPKLSTIFLLDGNVLSTKFLLGNHIFIWRPIQHVFIPFLSALLQVLQNIFYSIY